MCQERRDEMPDNKTIGKRIAQLREKKKLTQTQLAELLEVGPSTVRMWETGERIPRDEMKVKLSKLLGRSVKYIFFDD